MSRLRQHLLNTFPGKLMVRTGWGAGKDAGEGTRCGGHRFPTVCALHNAKEDRRRSQFPLESTDVVIDAPPSQDSERAGAPREVRIERDMISPMCFFAALDTMTRKGRAAGGDVLLRFEHPAVANDASPSTLTILLLIGLWVPFR